MSAERGIVRRVLVDAARIAAVWATLALAVLIAQGGLNLSGVVTSDLRPGAPTASGHATSR